MNGHYDSPAWNKFGGFVGWLVKDQHSSYWISYSQVTFDSQARRGHLPWSPIWFGFGTYEKYGFPIFVSRLASCDIPLSLVSSDAQPSPNTPPASPTAPDQSYVYLWCMRKGEETAYPAGKGKRPDEDTP